MKNIILCTLSTCIFHLLTFCRRSRSFYDVKRAFLQCVDDVSIWWQMFNFVLLRPKPWFQFNSRIVRTNFSSIMTLNNWKMIAQTQSDTFRWRSRLRRRGVCLSSLLFYPDECLCRVWKIEWVEIIKKRDAKILTRNGVCLVYKQPAFGKV